MFYTVIDNFNIRKRLTVGRDFRIFEGKQNLNEEFQHLLRFIFTTEQTIPHHQKAYCYIYRSRYISYCSLRILICANFYISRIMSCKKTTGMPAR